MKASIRTRFAVITAACALVLFGMVLVIWHVTSVGDGAQFEDEVLAEVSRTAASVLAAPVASGDLNRIQSIARGVSDNPRIKALRISNTAGSEVVNLGNQGSFGSKTHVRLLVESSVQSGAAPRRVGVLQLAFNPSEEPSTVTATAPRLFPALFALILACLVSAGIGLWLVVLKPLSKILDSLVAAGNGAEPETVAWRYKDEIGTVVDAYNTMIDNRRKHANELQELRDTLEGQIAEKSVELADEIASRERAEAEVARGREQLDADVDDRTQELQQNNEALLEANEALSEQISQLTKAEKELEQQATTDTLTGLPNRLSLESVAKKMLDTAAIDSSNVGVMFLDVDNFKTVNDTLGHSAGDKLLREAVMRITGTLYEKDVVIRYGGDEFIILVQYEATEERMAQVSQSIIEVMAEPFSVNHTIVETGASIGISMYPEHGEQLETLLRNADTAMYRSKELGRGRCTIYSPELTEETKDRMKMRLSLKSAIAQDELDVFFQPIVSMRTGISTKCEALLRWRHPEKGILSPGTFLATAEESGLISTIDRRVLQQACAGCREMIDAGLDMTVSVNLSSVSLKSGSAIDEIVTALTSYDLMPESLCIEITEDAVVDKNDRTLDILHQIREMGVRLSIDDFGTGYSSLSYLKRLPVQELKLDRAFVGDLPEDETVRSIVISIVNMCRSLGVSTVAEGVENMQQYQMAANVGCDNIQGFLVSKPLPKEEVIDFLRNAPVYPSRSATMASGGGFADLLPANNIS